MLYFRAFKKYKKMKKIVIILLTSLFAFNLTFSQDNQKYHHVLNRTYKKEYKILSKINLFEKWDYSNVVYTKDKTIFKLKNINIDIQKNKFVFKDSKNIYQFVFTDLDFILINSKKYRSIYYEDGSVNKIFEVVAEYRGISLLKGFYINFSEYSGGMNTFMFARENKNYTIKDRYYVKLNNEIKKIKLKRKYILSVLKDKKRLITDYVKKHKLSYNDERDVKEIFNYYARI